MSYLKNVYNVGDKVIVTSGEYDGTTVNVSSIQVPGWIHVDGNNNAFKLTEVLPEEIYNSPLMKVLREC